MAETFSDKSILKVNNFVLLNVKKKKSVTGRCIEHRCSSKECLMESKLHLVVFLLLTFTNMFIGK